MLVCKTILFLLIFSIEILALVSAKTVYSFSLKKFINKTKWPLLIVFAGLNLTVAALLFQLINEFEFYLLTFLFVPTVFITLYCIFLILLRHSPTLLEKLKPADGTALYKKLKAAFITAFILIYAAGLWGTFVTRKNIEITRQTIYFDRLPEALDGLAVAHLTDFHYGAEFDTDLVDRVVKKTNELKPDVIFLTGDFLNLEAEYMPKLTSSLRRLNSQFGIYAVLGNADFYDDAGEIAEKLNEARIIVLRNQSVIKNFSNKNLRISIAGVDDKKDKRLNKKNNKYTKAFYAVNKDDFTFFLAHRPSDFDKVIDYPFDLMLAGHTHGGQVTLGPLSISRFFTPYVEGLYEKEGKHLFVSRGLGTSKIPIRFGSTPEIALLTLKSNRLR